MKKGYIGVATNRALSVAHCAIKKNQKLRSCPDKYCLLVLTSILSMIDLNLFVFLFLGLRYII